VTAPYSTPVRTADCSAEDGQYIPVDASQNSVTVRLPAGTAPGLRVIVHCVAVSGGNKITVAAFSGDSFDVAGGATTYSLQTSGETVLFTRGAASGVWYPQDGASLAQTDGRYTSDRVSAVKYPALRRWYAALANRHFAPANAIVIGDSLTEGQGASSKANRYLSRLQSSLRTRYPSNGSAGGASDCFMPSWRAVFGPDSTWAATDYTTSGSMFQDSYGPFGQHTLDFGAAAAVRTWTFTGTKAVLWYLNGHAGTFTWSLDGGAANTINPTGVFGLASVQVYSGTSGTHTIAVTAGGSSGTSTCGLQLWDGDEAQGIRFHDFSHVSYQASQFHDAGSTGGVLNQSVINAAYAAIAPALVVIEFGINEQGNNTAPSVLGTSVQQIITDVKGAVAATPSFLVAVPYNPNASNPTYSWQQYSDALYAVQAADPVNVTIADWNLRMPGSATTSPALYTASDHLHPTNMGHSFIADFLAGELSAA
jgi:lysophospholipase L1-like esterase